MGNHTSISRVNSLAGTSYSRKVYWCGKVGFSTSHLRYLLSDYVIYRTTQQSDSMEKMVHVTTIDIEEINHVHTLRIDMLGTHTGGTPTDDSSLCTQMIEWVYYEDIKDDHDLSHILDHVFVSTAHLNTNNIDLDSNRRYVPKPEEKFVFKEMQILMYAVFEDHLNACAGGTSLYGQC